MGVGKGNCAICGKPLMYYRDAREMTCVTCGKRELGHSVCEDGHYVCDSCHRAGGVDCIMDVCLHATSANPIEIAMQAMDDARIYPNGPEHHTLAGAALLTAYANAGGGLDREEALAELKTRSLDIPGGTCGFWGVCGAAAGAGIFASLLLGSSPLHKDAWPLPQQLVSDILAKLAEIGGPRCCKRTSRVAIEEASRFLRETGGADMPLCKLGCKYTALNRECIGGDCPYFQK